MIHHPAFSGAGRVPSPTRSILWEDLAEAECSTPLDQTGPHHAPHAGLLSRGGSEWITLFSHHAQED